MIVFLDISGPLLTEASASRSKSLAFPLFEREAVERVRGRLLQSGAQVVVSSTYALHGRSVIEQWFRRNDWALSLHADWTSAQNPSDSRDREIQAWLNRHPEESQFAIIDDIEMPPGLLRARQVHVRGWSGVSREDDLRLAFLLGVQPDSPTSR